MLPSLAASLCAKLYCQCFLHSVSLKLCCQALSPALLHSLALELHPQLYCTALLNGQAQALLPGFASMFAAQVKLIYCCSTAKQMLRLTLSRTFRFLFVE
jgi:hypothetical protein